MTICDEMHKFSEPNPTKPTSYHNLYGVQSPLSGQSRKRGKWGTQAKSESCSVNWVFWCVLWFSNFYLEKAVGVSDVN